MLHVPMVTCSILLCSFLSSYMYTSLFHIPFLPPLYSYDPCSLFPAFMFLCFMFPCTSLDLSKKYWGRKPKYWRERKGSITDEYIDVPGRIIGARARVAPPSKAYAYVPVYSLTDDVWSLTGLQLFFTFITRLQIILLRSKLSVLSRCITYSRNQLPPTTKRDFTTTSVSRRNVTKSMATHEQLFTVGLNMAGQDNRMPHASPRRGFFY